MNNNLISLSNFSSLFLKDIPLIDLRSEIEFNKGSFPSSINLPILNNEERKKVGICFKNEGQEYAIKYGHSLIKNNIKEKRIEAWIEFINKNPDGFLFCSRGGLRSEIAQKWLKEKSYTIPRIKGGFNSLRRFLLNEFEKSIENNTFIILSGRTGAGKTVLIQKITNSIDLEKRAQHRGSSFGRQISKQYSQINFENSIIIDLLKIIKKEQKNIIIEDESFLIGQISIPLLLRNKMRTAPIIVLQVLMEERITGILQEYIINSCNLFFTKNKNNGFKDFSENLIECLNRISKKLGGLNYNDIKNDMIFALDKHRIKNDINYHRIWIKKLLEIYYDPMYDYGLNKRSDQIIFQGNYNEIYDWLIQNN